MRRKPRITSAYRKLLTQVEKQLRQAASAPETELPVVVYVHGVGDQPAPAQVKREWDKALFGIDMGARTRMAYWADLVHARPLETGVKTLRRAARGIGPEAAELSPKAAQFADKLRKRMARWEAPQRRAPGRVAAKVLPGLIRRPLARWVMELFIQDAAEYFYRPAQRKAIQDRLRTLLIPKAQPYLIVGHSLGSVIAFDVLSDLTEKEDVPVLHFITLGSPLGLEEVQDNLASMAVPRVVSSWHNFFDTWDPVALDSTLGDDFRARIWQEVQDVEVENKHRLRLPTPNPHSATGYLGTRPVWDDVCETVGGDFASPAPNFVIAKDVAAEVAEPDVRHPVLIELAEGAQHENLQQKIENIARQVRELSHDDKAARIERLQRFVAARLTPHEIYALAARNQDLRIGRIWKNSRKKALVNVSTRTLNTYTARVSYRATGEGIAWAVLDTGIRSDHPHFERFSNIAARWDCTQVGGPQEVRKDNSDKDGHGTHVAGIIAGTGKEGGTEYTGMAPEAKLHIYKVLDDEGQGDDSWIIKALNHIEKVNENAHDLVIHGVNLSLGGPFNAEVYGCGFSPLCRELRRLWRAGVLVCVSAGNEAQIAVQTEAGLMDLNFDLSIGDPANLEEAIAVGSVHRERPHMYGVSYFSSRGPTADGRIKPDLVAPGEEIYSCSHQFGRRRYVAFSGTSMACPHVSGLLAAFLSVRREFIGFPDQVKQILMKSCVDLGRDRYHQGAGMPNIVKMLMET